MIRTGKMLLSGGLILASGSYAWWHHQSQHPVALAMAKPAAQKPVPADVAMNTATPVVTAPVAGVPPGAVTETSPQSENVAKPEAAAKRKLNPAKDKPARVATVMSAPGPAAPPPPPAEPLNAVALAPQPVVSTGRYADGEFIGNASDGQWGPVQVKVVIHNGDISDVIALEYPIHRQRSAEISEWAIPQLKEEVIKAQSADIEWVTQASFTSENYQQSLASALGRARKQP